MARVHQEEHLFLPHVISAMANQDTRKTLKVRYYTSLQYFQLEYLPSSGGKPAFPT